MSRVGHRLSAEPGCCFFAATSPGLASPHLTFFAHSPLLHATDNHLITVPMWKSKVCKPDEARGKKRATAYLIRVRLAGGGSKGKGTGKEPSVKLVWKYFEDFAAFDASWRKWFPNLPWALPPRHLSLRKMGSVEKDDRQRALAKYLQGE